ncbi:MAG: methionyl-tRNA formyltransferase [Anaerolineae bacterium]|jgi:methionyl-tRNA formyltransferase|nr:methionyl-tRNA formyltransferase [Anaerolineae bacterium]MBT4309922.1 methionyl-tRNA formyltransferase [Anaerolineae bacterium]MBT4456796.1 methionyl-tRNA formyltransferase [Anaerolineae bacterium]MBT4842154.1 methionyl-tRNA formyltransferase [Anaerolineae bacterium]MBT6060518.1 methionyl-tRNA formyltransferase [Anaerolineae bacterium]
MKKSPRILFMGSPDFAAISLRALAQKFNVVGVLTQPDRRAGRGKKLVSPPVKILADELDIPVIQPYRIKDDIAMDELRRFAPDLIVVAAYGQILRPELLALPRYGCVNVHGSLLPRWRGAAPIQAAILAGDDEAGITIMLMDEGIDTGDMLSKRALPIADDDTAETLFNKLAPLGAELLVETLPKYISGEITSQLQPEEDATYAKMLKKADGELDFSKTAVELERQTRAFSPWPSSFFEWEGKRVKVHRAKVDGRKSPGIGSKLKVAGAPAIGTSEGILILVQIQPAGKKRMDGKSFLAGGRDW